MLLNLWMWKIALQWRNYWRDCVSNHQLHDCLLNRLFRRRSKKTSSKLHVTGLCAGNSLLTGEFQMASVEISSKLLNHLSWRLNRICICMDWMCRIIYFAGVNYYVCIMQYVSLYTRNINHIMIIRILKSSLECLWFRECIRFPCAWVGWIRRVIYFAGKTYSQYHIQCNSSLYSRHVTHIMPAGE